MKYDNVFNYWNSERNYFGFFSRNRKQETLDADPKVIKHITFARNLDRSWNMTMFLITEIAKETILDFSQGTVRVL